MTACRYDDMWRCQLGLPAGAPVVSETKDWTLEQLLDRQARHVASCAVCQRVRSLAVASWMDSFCCTACKCVCLRSAHLAAASFASNALFIKANHSYYAEFELFAQGMRTVETAGRVSEGAAAASALAAAASAAFLAVARRSEPIYMAAPLGFAAAAIALAFAKKGIDEFYEDRFINGTKKWRRKGGLSLVKM